jgi:NAD(P)H-dependent FMN reductase
MKVLAFAASSSKKSINKQLATYASSLIEGAEVTIIDINDYEMPIFNEDREKDIGQPQHAKSFYQQIGEADLLIISYAEHNGTYTAAFKNLFDWTSRIEQKVYQHKPVIILSTSPGPGGAKTVLNTALTSAPHFAANVIGSLSIPSFYDNFDSKTRKISNKILNDNLKEIINKLN